MRFANPVILMLLLLIPFASFFAKRLETRIRGSLRFSDEGFLQKAQPSMRVMLSESMIYLRALALALMIFAAARPQAPIKETRIYVEGVDIVLVVDASGSMHAMDFEMGGKRVDRLTVVKSVVPQFIERRPNDRIGMVAFSALAYTVCPLTLDHDWLEKNLERVHIGMIEDGTAIGSAISCALNRLKDSEAKNKLIVLLTDGRNNAGSISPMAAAEAAKSLGVKIYTIGAGTKGMAPFPMKDMFGNVVLQPVEIQLDDELLQKIADLTGGRYFRATDTRSLWQVYDDIDKLEKTKIEDIGYMKYNELFGAFLFPALFLILGEIILSNTILRRIP